MFCQLVFFSSLSYILYTFHFLSQAIALAILGVYLLIFTVMLIKLKNPSDYVIMRT